MNIIFDPVTSQYILSIDPARLPIISIEDIKRMQPPVSQFPSEQTLRTEYFFSDRYRGHSHQAGNGCRHCWNYINLRGPDYCPYSEF